MRKTVNEYDFIKAFEDAERDGNFSREGLLALFDWLTEFEEETGEEIELDVIALCSDFTEYENLAELKGIYWDIKDMEELKEKTLVIEIEDCDNFIIQDF